MLTARTRRPVRVDAQVAGVDLGRFGFVERWYGIERRERGVATRLGVERRDAHEPVHSLLAREHPVGIATLDRERRRRDAGFVAGLHRVDLDTKPRRSAHRRNMRRSMSAQSCASVPPAPECTSQIASRSSCSPVNSARSSSRSSSPRAARSRASISGSCGLVVSSRASSASVSTSATRRSSPSTSSTSSRTRARLRGHLARRVLVVPEVGLAALLLRARRGACGLRRRADTNARPRPDVGARPSHR